MTDLESQLRSCLLDQAQQITPRPEAVQRAVAALRHRRRRRTAVGSVAALTAAGALVVAALSWHPITTTPPDAPAGPPSAADAATTPAAPPCRAQDLSLEPGGSASPMTGERPAPLVITNTSADPCSLSGFPEIALFAADGTTLPFTYTHASQYIRWPTPPRVLLTPGGPSALLLVTKYRCDVGDRTVAARIRVDVDGGSLSGPVGTTMLAYCQGGPDDPGQTVSVNPFVPSS